MIIAVASGKGGTGKTSVAAALAHLAALERPIVLADADVAAANLELVLAPVKLEEHVFMGGQVAVIDPPRCEPCLPVCPNGAIVVAPEAPEAEAADPVRLAPAPVRASALPLVASAVGWAVRGLTCWVGDILEERARTRWGPSASGAARGRTTSIANAWADGGGRRRRRRRGGR